MCPIVLRRVEEIVMRLKFLPDLIALPLHRFGIGVIYAQNIAHPCLDLRDERVPPVEMAAIACAKAFLLSALVQCRRHGIGVYFCNHGVAIGCTQKPLIQIELGLCMVDLLHKRIGMQAACDKRANARKLCRIVVGIKLWGGCICLHEVTESWNDTSSYHDPVRLF